MVKWGRGVPTVKLLERSSSPVILLQVTEKGEMQEEQRRQDKQWEQLSAREQEAAQQRHVPAFLSHTSM